MRLATANIQLAGPRRDEGPAPLDGGRSRRNNGAANAARSHSMYSSIRTAIDRRVLVDRDAGISLTD